MLSPRLGHILSPPLVSELPNRNNPRINARSLFAPTCARQTDYKYRSHTSVPINIGRIQPHLQSLVFINFGAMAAQQSAPPVQQSLPRVPDIQFRVLVIGRANAGKTSLLQKVCDTTESPEIYKTGLSGNRERVCSRFQRHFRSHRPARFLNSMLQQRLAMLILVDDG
jgi:hypothetical protein